VGKLRNQHRHLKFFGALVRLVSTAEAVLKGKAEAGQLERVAGVATTVCRRMLAKTLFMREALLVGSIASRIGAAARAHALSRDCGGASPVEPAAPDSVLLAGRALAPKRERQDGRDAASMHEAAKRARLGAKRDAVPGVTAAKVAGPVPSGGHPPVDSSASRKGLHKAKKAKRAGKAKRVARPLSLDQGFG